MAADSPTIRAGCSTLIGANNEPRVDLYISQTRDGELLLTSRQDA
jgi:hypothetical protein